MLFTDMPPAHVYWARPIPKDPGDDPRKIYEAVGWAISNWEFFEQILSSLYLTLIESHTEAARRAYGSISTARGRQEAIKYAAESAFLDHEVSEIDVERFETLMKHVQAASTRRNEIVHAEVVGFSGHQGSFLLPSHHASNKNKPFKLVNRQGASLNEIVTGTYRYVSADVWDFIDRLGHVQEALIGYINHLSATYPAFAPKAGDAWDGSCPPKT